MLLNWKKSYDCVYNSFPALLHTLCLPSLDNGHFQASLYPLFFLLPLSLSLILVHTHFLLHVLYFIRKFSFKIQSHKWLILGTLSIFSMVEVTLSCELHRDAEQVAGPTLPWTGQQLDSYSGYVGRSGHHGASVGRGLWLILDWAPYINGKFKESH